MTLHLSKTLALKVPSQQQCLLARSTENLAEREMRLFDFGYII